jgi:hypothetical protein
VFPAITFFCYLGWRKQPLDWRKSTWAHGWVACILLNVMVKTYIITLMWYAVMQLEAYWSYFRDILYWHGFFFTDEYGYKSPLRRCGWRSKGG